MSASYFDSSGVRSHLTIVMASRYDEMMHAIMPCKSRYRMVQLGTARTTSNPAQGPHPPARRFTPHSFCPTPRHRTPGTGREVLPEVNGCFAPKKLKKVVRSCDLYIFLHNVEYLFSPILSTLSWLGSIHRFSAKLSTCITGH